MELIERDGFLTTLQSKFDSILDGQGHCVFITGESGIGKTSLVNAFCKLQESNYRIYSGTCDALFTPRPLAPLYDILLQIGSDIIDNKALLDDRATLFANIFQVISNLKDPSIILFEDIHWADEATLDFIKFLGRRISRIPCLFLLTYRDNEIHASHPLRIVLGQLPPDNFSRLLLPPLSRKAVEKLSAEKGYVGEDVFSVSGGNPFYVNEILASYSPGIPDNIRDSILAVFNQMNEKTRKVWELLSVLPTRFELKYLEIIQPFYADAVANCMAAKIIVVENQTIFFKHELYRRTVETALSPLVRVELHKQILHLFLKHFEATGEIERIIHHAKNANEYGTVTQYAPVAAKKAAALGAHIEAAKLFYTAIEYYPGNDKNELLELYESYAYECYLTNRMKEAIIYQCKALTIWKDRNDQENIANSLRLLSRFWWFEGNHAEAESFARRAIEQINEAAPSKIVASVMSSMSQLKMLSEETESCVYWGEKAQKMAKELGEDAIYAHASINLGTLYFLSSDSRQKGLELLQDSLDISLKKGFQENIARAYTNFSSGYIELKEYESGNKYLEKGIAYCEARDLDSWTSYMISWKSRLLLETGNWNEALRIAENLINAEGHARIIRCFSYLVAGTVKMRRGDLISRDLLMEAKSIAFDANEIQRMVPVCNALLEYEWLYSHSLITEQELSDFSNRYLDNPRASHNKEFEFWLHKVRGINIRGEAVGGHHTPHQPEDYLKPLYWKKTGCPYMHAMTLFLGNDEEKREAIAMVQRLDADVVYDKLKQEMRAEGIKKIPRGIRKTTIANPAQLTGREMDVLQLLREGMQNKEIAGKLFISAKTVDHHISNILFKLEVSSRAKAVMEATALGILK